MALAAIDVTNGGGTFNSSARIILCSQIRFHFFRPETTLPPSFVHGLPRAAGDADSRRYAYPVSRRYAALTGFVRGRLSFIEP
ncbi:MAG TPA: hypothetical protein VM029_16560 [Opitutaceae bacterium]|nr:hypothetical protein [Opitutaceae bacterium]